MYRILSHCRIEQLLILNQRSHIPPSVRVERATHMKKPSLTQDSRKDTITTQPKITRRQEAAMAAIRQAVVCWVHDTDHRQLAEGRDK